MWRNGVLAPITATVHLSLRSQKSWPNLDPDEDQLIHPDPVKLRNARADQGNGLKRPQAGSPSTLMIMHELEQPRETFVLQRGQYNMPDRSAPVQANVPDSLSHGDRTAPKNRLELARWLFDPSHPLTARVAVNRIWQQFFSSGLVETSEKLWISRLATVPTRIYLTG